MAEDYYPDMGGEGGGGPPPAEPKEPEKTEDEAPESATALLPKSVLAGKEFNPGDEVVLKVTHVFEDEVEVEYAPSKEKPTTKEAPTADEDIDAMDVKGT